MITTKVTNICLEGFNGIKVTTEYYDGEYLVFTGYTVTSKDNKDDVINFLNDDVAQNIIRIEEEQALKNARIGLIQELNAEYFPTPISE